MITADNCFLEAVNSPVRKLKARVELYENGNSTLLDTFYNTDRLKSINIERVGEQSKFFGYGICQRLNTHIIDPNRQLNISTANNFEVVFGTECNYVYTCPIFYVSEVHRDELTNELSVTAYDALYKASEHLLSEIELPKLVVTLKDYAIGCAAVLGLPFYIPEELEEDFALNVTDTVSVDDTENLRQILNEIAEATQTIYYIDSEWRLTFKRLDRDGLPVMGITKSHYYTLDSSTNKRLGTICHATELGNNVSASTTVAGTTQYVRNNSFWELRDDVGDLVEKALAAVGGLTINQFECKWRGNFLLEIGDKIALTTKDNDTVIAYVLDDVIEYNGAFSETTRWKYEAETVETESTPSNIGEAIKQTYAKVDKANKQIELLVSETEANTQEITTLKLNTDSINASVEKVIRDIDTNVESINGDITTLNNRVDMAMTAENVQIAIQSELSNGIDKVSTKTGFTFDEIGLTIEKTGSEMSTQITEDGMTVFRDDTAVLIANNIGVNATNLHATTYLIVGKNSRFEDYGSDRTGCFWIGA